MISPMFRVGRFRRFWYVPALERLATPGRPKIIESVSKYARNLYQLSSPGTRLSPLWRHTTGSAAAGATIHSVRASGLSVS